MVYHIPISPIVFPDPYGGDDDGLIAVGGDLSVERLELAYEHGIFPWYSYADCPEPMWYCPLERFVIIPGEIHVSHSMRTLINHHRYRVTWNQVWDASGQLVGGLYGVTLLDCFFGESMFSLVPSASKLALIYLARKMQQCGGKLIDCQLETPHLKSMGGRTISYEEYMDRLYF